MGNDQEVPIEVQEVPIEVKPYESEGHKLETRVFARQIHETYCAQERCEFYGRHAAQGICWGSPDAAEVKYLERREKESDDMLAEMREIRDQQKMDNKAYIDYLESHLYCDWMNQQFTLDECVRLRAENAKLRLKAGQ